MTAKQLTIIHGPSLIGRRVETEAIGEYPGGIATVTELAPDPEAPEIDFKVRHHNYGEIGVFEWERVALVPNDATQCLDEESTTKTRTQAGR